MASEYSVGIDPGWKNLGISIVKKSTEGLELIHSLTLNPSEIADAKRCRLILSEVITQIPPQTVKHFVVERYVSYQNVNTAEAENILMLIGGLLESGRHLFYGSDILMLRAIEWKMELVKTLVKLKGFNNPSDKLDKKFSIAAAKACLDKEPTFKTDHEADSICLATIPFLRESISAKTTGKNSRTITTGLPIST
jgi:hypothetical protein